ncbi:MAG: Druantia anti-phage system protein DruA [bacterium]
MEKEIRIRGRVVTADDLTLIWQLITAEGSRGRTHLSQRLCRLWDWRQAHGAYREIACRELLRKLAQRGFIVLPEPLKLTRRPGYRNRTSLPPTLETTPLFGKLNDFLPVTVELVSRTPREQLYNGLIGAYHYLGYGQGTGEQLKYVIALETRPLGAIGFSAAAWRIACRDRFMGWNEQARQKNLHLIVNNHRFLILPWIKITNLASWILAHVTRRLRQDWQTVYAHDIVLVETFVEKKRFHGTCYRAANWIGVGETVGRGRNDHTSSNWLPIKQVYLYPLDANFRQRCQTI